MAMAGTIALPITCIVAPPQSPEKRRPLAVSSVYMGRRQGPLLVVARKASSGGTNKQRQEERTNLSISSPPGRSSSPPVSSNTVGVKKEEDEGVEERALSEVVENGDSAEPGALVDDAQEDSGLQDTMEESNSRGAESPEEIGKALSELRREGLLASSQEPASSSNFWGGVVEETRLIEWPVFSKVLGTTGVVMAMILGSSVVLLTVNAILAAGSDYIFNGPAFQDFAKTHFNLVF